MHRIFSLCSGSGAGGVIQLRLGQLTHLTESLLGTLKNEKSIKKCFMHIHIVIPVGMLE